MCGHRSTVVKSNLIPGKEKQTTGVVFCLLKSTSNLAHFCQNWAEMAVLLFYLGCLYFPGIRQFIRCENR